MLRNMLNYADLPKIIIFGTIGYSIFIKAEFIKLYIKYFILRP